jgi:uncharacterized protein DUF3800
MPKVYRFYLDDSGTRYPDHPGSPAAHGHDWFGLGGVLVREADEEFLRSAHDAFCKKWELSKPLHSSDIRSKSGAFAWLGTCSKNRLEDFLEELYQLVARAELLGIACVIDRPGYNRRYSDEFGHEKWRLCKTAFSIVVERAAKFARKQDYKLRVFVERSDKNTDRWMNDYYNDLRTAGAPFDQSRSEKYRPLSAREFSETLYEFRTKTKSSVPMQIADLYLWPMCIGGYDPENRAYRRLLDGGRLVNRVLPREALIYEGIKYSCFESINPRKH